MRETHTAQTSIFDFYSKHEFSDFLHELSCVLDDHPDLLGLLETDLLTGGAQATGRKGLSVESIFRCMLLKQITQVSYKMLAFHLADSHSYRTFARLDRDCYPGKSALSGNIRRLRPETLKTVFETLAIKIVDEGTMSLDVLRVDSTVVSSNIAPPLDSQLLDDGIRVLSRLFSKSRDTTGVKLRLTDYRQKSRSLAAGIFYAKKAEKDALYEELVPLAWKVIEQSERAIQQVRQKCDCESVSTSWIAQVEHFQSLLRKVIDQTQRRVFNDEEVPAREKVVSLFEPHTDIIIKGSRDIAYGHKVNLASEKHGFITVVMIEEGNPSDAERFIPLLEKHQSLYGCIAQTTIADGGYASLDNVAKGKMLGVKRVAFHKQNGVTLKAMGLQKKTLKRLKDFRAGIEGNISELKRAFGATRALWKGEDGFMSFVWASVISYNLTRLVRLNSG